MPSKQPAPQVEQQVVQTAARLYKERGDLQERLIDLETKVQEHQVVMESLDKLDGDRRCFRLMGGVLVQRKVGQVHAAIKENLGHLQKVQSTHIVSAPEVVWHGDQQGIQA